MCVCVGVGVVCLSGRRVGLDQCASPLSSLFSGRRRIPLLTIFPDDGDRAGGAR